MTGTSLIATMANRYNMDPVQFAKTVRKTVMPSEHTDEQFAAFMMVAYQYGLNPITREIYAYPARKGGGINPVVSIDGWINLVNSHPQSDGFEISLVMGKEDKPYSATCTMWRKDKSHPAIVTEYYSECYRNTDPWNGMPKRMLRHKAFKEAARLAFGFAGITDEDEARDMMEQFRVIAKEEIKQDPELAAWIKESETVIDEDGVIADDPNLVSEGSSEPISPPTPPDEPAAAALTRDVLTRDEAIGAVLQIATQSHLPADKRIDWLNEKILAFEGEFPKPFIKDLLQIGSRVANGDLTIGKAKTFLEQLPMNALPHDRFVTISYFVHEMLGMKSRDWYYDHVDDYGVPQRITVGGVPKLSLRDCIAYQDMLKGERTNPPPLPKRKVGRPRKVRPLPAA